MEQHWTSYKRGTIFFPKELKEQTYLLYAFVRKADDIVDDMTMPWTQAKKNLLAMKQSFHTAYQWWWNEWELCTEFAQLCHDTAIPIERVDSFFDAMVADCSESFYKTYKELQHYMVGSAEVVWLMMCKIIWYNPTEEKEVFFHARLLWEAMQYTNFLRDIKEDRLQYNRLYMPLDRLQQFDCSHDMVRRFCEGADCNDSRDKFMAHQIITTKELYDTANKWIKKLNKKGRFAVLVASHMYEAILDKVWKNQYDVFNRDAHTTKLEKFTVFMRTLFGYDK